MENTEEEILANPLLLARVNTTLDQRHFSMAFLAKTVEWYDSWICLRSQPHLSPSFCFRYLFDNGTDSADNWTDYYDILRYFQRFQPTVPIEEIDQAHDEEIKRRASMAAMPRKS
jgi:hypothetical protein